MLIFISYNVEFVCLGFFEFVWLEVEGRFFIVIGIWDWGWVWLL